MNKIPRRREEELKPHNSSHCFDFDVSDGEIRWPVEILNIDLFEVEPEWVYGVLAIGIGILYKEIRDLGRETWARLQKIDEALKKTRREDSVPRNSN